MYIGIEVSDIRIRQRKGRRMGIHKRNRLRRNDDFRRVYRRGKSTAGAYMAVYVLLRRDTDIKAGFSVSKKIGNSVVRNRVRRRMRESFRLLLPGIKPGVSLIFVARNAIIRTDYQGIRRNMIYLLQKMEVLDTKRL